MNLTKKEAKMVLKGMYKGHLKKVYEQIDAINDKWPVKIQDDLTNKIIHTAVEHNILTRDTIKIEVKLVKQGIVQTMIDNKGMSKVKTPTRWGR